MVQKVVCYVRLMTTLPTSVAKRVIESWAETLKAEAESIYAKLLSRIPDVQKFQETLAGVSIKGFQNYVDPNFVSRAGKKGKTINIGQASNLKRSYNKYIKKLKYLFETVDGIPAKRFKELVDLKKDDYASGVVERTLPFTGTKIEGLGPASIAGLWLVKDVTAEGKLRPGDTIVAGSPFLTCPAEDGPSFKGALQGRLGQAGADIVKAEFSMEVMKEENDHINRIVQNFVDPALNIVPFATGGPSHVDYILGEADQLCLEIKVTVTT